MLGSPILSCAGTGKLANWLTCSVSSARWSCLWHNSGQGELILLPLYNVAVVKMNLLGSVPLKEVTHKRVLESSLSARSSLPSLAWSAYRPTCLPSTLPQPWNTPIPHFPCPPKFLHQARKPIHWCRKARFKLQS